MTLSKGPTMQSERLATGGRIDRTRPLNITFNGRQALSFCNPYRFVDKIEAFSSVFWGPSAYTFLKWLFQVNAVGILYW